MAGKDSTTNPPEFVYLTPETFSRLDSMCRAKVGRLINVLPPEKMEGNFAASSCWAVGICVNPGDPPRERYYKDGAVIDLANQIEVARFGSTPRPEMDWSAIPPNAIFDFLTWHEIGHLVMGHLSVVGLCDNSAPWNCQDPRERFLARAEMERRADRYAWGVLFPGTSLPVRKNPEFNLKELDKFARKYKRFFEQPERSFDPLTSVPGSMVLEGHLKRGIAWAEPVARRLNLFQAIGDGLASLATALNLTGGGGCQPVIEIGSLAINPTPGTYPAYPIVVNG